MLLKVRFGPIQNGPGIVRSDYSERVSLVTGHGSDEYELAYNRL